MKKFIWVMVVISSFAAHATILYPAGAPTTQSCSVLTTPVADSIDRTVAYPSDWKIIVTCSDGMWEQILRHYDLVGVSNYAFTIHASKITVIRGTVFRTLSDAQQNHIVLHELGHIIVPTNDEDKANEFAKKHGF